MEPKGFAIDAVYRTNAAGRDRWATLNICMCITQNIYDKAKVAAYSYHENNPKATIYVFCEDDKLDWKIPKLKVVNVSNMESEFAHTNNMWGYMAMVRLKLFQMIKADKIIYVDYDTICLAPLDGLWKTNIDGYDVGMVSEPDKSIGGTLYSEKLQQGGKYFNSGVCLMNLKRQREGNGQRLLDNEATERVMYPDQDLINKYWDIKEIDSRYNTGIYTGNGHVENAAIYHYMGLKKPWNDFGTRFEAWWDIRERMNGEGI